jgi:hypothetical protein
MAAPEQRDMQRLAQALAALLASWWRENHQANVPTTQVPAASVPEDHGRAHQRHEVRV